MGPRARLKNMAASVASMDFNQLVESSVQTEHTLCLLYARACVLTLLHRWPSNVPMGMAAFGQPNTVINYCKLVTFRGTQFPPVPSEPETDSRLALTATDAIYGAGAGPPSAVTILRPVLLKLLNSTAQPNSGAGGGGSSLAVGAGASAVAALQALQPFASMFTLRCVEELQTAAGNEQFHDFHWGARSRSLSDEQVLTEPNVEFAGWGLELLVTQDCSQVFSVEVLARLGACLRSPNMPLKETIFKLLTRLTSRYIEGPLGTSPNSGGLVAAINVDSPMSAAGLLLQGLPAARVVLEALRTGLSLPRLTQLAKTRVKQEQRHGRLYFSRYVQSLTQLVLSHKQLVEKLEAELGREGEVGGGGESGTDTDGTSEGAYGEGSGTVASTTTGRKKGSSSSSSSGNSSNSATGLSAGQIQLALDSSSGGSEPVVHHGTVCSECSTEDMTGTRYDCLMCANYMLCQTCARGKDAPRKKTSSSSVRMKATGAAAHEDWHALLAVHRPMVDSDVPLRLGCSVQPKITAEPVSVVCTACSKKSTESYVYQCMLCCDQFLCFACWDRWRRFSLRTDILARADAATTTTPLLMDSPGAVADLKRFHNRHHVYSRVHSSCVVPADSEIPLVERQFPRPLHPVPVGPPSAPRLIKTGEHSLVISWTPSECTSSLHQSPATQYLVQVDGGYAGREMGETVCKEVLTNSTTRLMLSGLSPSVVYRLRVRALTAAGAGEWSEVSTLSTDRGVAFTFDSANCGPAIFVSNDGLTASFGSSESWSTLLGTVPFVVGRNYWEMRLDKSATAYLFVGVASRDANLSTFLGGDEHGWGYIGDRALYHKRNKVKAYGERFLQGDTIGVTLDLDQGTLSFSKNGVDMGVAFDNLAGELYPAVAFYNQGQRVTLVRNSFCCPGAGVAVRGAPSEVSLQDVSEVSAAMASMVSRQPLPPDVLSAAYAGYRAWLSGSTFRGLTRGGYELQFDVSDAACAVFGLRARDRVHTQRGNATVVGVADRKIWVQVDGEEGAWFFTAQEIRERQAMGTFTVLHRESSNESGVAAGGWATATSLTSASGRRATSRSRLSSFNFVNSTSNSGLATPVGGGADGVSGFGSSNNEDGPNPPGENANANPNGHALRSALASAGGLSGFTGQDLNVSFGRELEEEKLEQLQDGSGENKEDGGGGGTVGTGTGRSGSRPPGQAEWLSGAGTNPSSNRSSRRLSLNHDHVEEQVRMVVERQLSGVSLLSGLNFGGWGGGGGDGGGIEVSPTNAALERDQDRAISLEEFVALADSTVWTPQMDAAMVHQINMYCDLKSLNPWNLPPSLVLEVIMPARPLIGGGSGGAGADAPGGGGGGSGSSSTVETFKLGDGKGSVAGEVAVSRKKGGDGTSSAFVGISAEPTPRATLCRLAVLKLFNDRLARVLPFVGVADGYQLSSGPSISPSLWLNQAHGSLQGMDTPLPFPVSPLVPTWVGVNLAISQYNGMGVQRRPVGEGICLAPLLCTLRGSVFLVSKKSVTGAVLERTVTQTKKAEDDYDYPEDLPQIMLNRPKAAATRAKSDPETRLSFSLFGQAFDELHFMEPSSLRMGYTHPMDDGQERTFKVKFEGEGVDDYGGPYRECFSQFTSELQATVTANDGKVTCVLPLLQPCPNWQNSVGQNRDKFVVNPSPSRPGGSGAHLYMEMYNFLGQMIGMALRSKIAVRVDFAPLMWKALVGQTITYEDLEAVDRSAVTIVEEIRRLCDRVLAAAPEGPGTNKDAGRPTTTSSRLARPGTARKQSKMTAVGLHTTAAAAAAAAAALVAEKLGDKTPTGRLATALAELKETLSELRWSTHLSDGSLVELVPGGGNMRVTVDNAARYLDTLVHCRLHEADRALFAMRDGLASIVPASILPLYTWRELELKVCGRPGLDVDLLQANTEYDDDVSPDEFYIQSLWRVLRSFGPDDRCNFLRFVWARSRLPPTAADFHQKFKIQAAVGEGPKESPNTYLPKSHTCFFSLNLPKYTSDEIMREKLLYAMYNCIEMDADFRLADNEMTGWSETKEDDDFEAY